MNQYSENPLYGSIKYYTVFPDEIRDQLKEKLYKSPVVERERVWNSFGLLFKEIEEAFIQFSTQRNEMAKTKGKPSFIEFCLDLYKIPTEDYLEFEKNIDRVIDYCNKELPEINKTEDFYAEFGNHCYICAIQDFPFNDLEEVKEYVFNKCSNLEKEKDKINIVFDNYSQAEYKKENDSFEIKIDQNLNLRHKSTDLIHEMSHLINYLDLLNQGKDLKEVGVYLKEKETTQIELDLVSKISPSLYKALFGEFLSVFQRVLFEIELYKNPDQDLSKLYAQTFNRCFKGANQEVNRSYILEDRIVKQPLSSLSHAVALAKIIAEKL